MCPLINIIRNNKLFSYITTTSSMQNRGKSMGDDNVLVECSECSASYHQKCHKPNVTTKEINDPRLIWYCSKCMKKMKREMVCTVECLFEFNVLYIPFYLFVIFTKNLILNLAKCKRFSPARISLNRGILVSILYC